MGELSVRRTISFVLRVWQEPMLEGDKREWRGQVEHVTTGQAAYFRNLSGLLAFIAKLAPGFVEHEQDAPPEVDSGGEGARWLERSRV